MPIDPDDTIRLRPPPPSAPRGRRGLAFGLLASAAAGAGAYVAFAPHPAPSPEPLRAVTPPAAPAPAAQVAVVPALPPPPPQVDEAALAQLLPDRPTMVRLRENPRIFVLLFPDLDIQAATLNRVAALVEKASLPRDRVVDGAELAQAIAAAGEQAATWYLGHDYRGADIARFFRLAAAQDIPLTEGERWLAARFAEARALVPATAEIALISVANPDHRFDAEARNAILRHEIGHGQFFTRPDVAAHVRMVWADRFNAATRDAFRGFLGREGYDTANEELMANEAMAFLLFTPDPRFFTARHVGLTEVAVDRLRALMRDGFPAP